MKYPRIPARECCFSRFGSLGGETHSLVGKGVKDPIRTTGPKIWCSVYYNPFTVEASLRPPPTPYKAGFWNDFERRRERFSLHLENVLHTVGNNKKLRQERFNSSAISELIFLLNKNKHGLIVYLLVTSRPLLFSEKIIFCLFGVCIVHFDNVIMI
jgi:hypothetical protein